jgi:hypothetical protein
LKGESFLEDSNDVKLTYTIGIDLQFCAYFEGDQFKGISIFFKTENGDIAARKCDDNLTYDFFKERAIRDYKKKFLRR